MRNAADVERRAKRRRLHEASLAARQHGDLRRRLVDAVCELEIAGNEVRDMAALVNYIPTRISLMNTINFPEILQSDTMHFGAESDV